MDDQPSITCPECGRTSHHPKDIEHGYCGWCHDFTSLGEISMPSAGVLLSQPDHRDVYRINGACRWNDKRKFEDTIIGVDMASLGYMANVRAGLIQQDLTDIEGDEDLPPEQAERERLVIAWIDAFTAGQQFVVMGQAMENMEESIKTDGNRRMRRKKK